MTNSEKTLIAKINRRLDGEKLHVARPQAESYVGRYYIQDIYSSLITHTHQNLEHLAQHFGIAST